MKNINDNEIFEFKGEKYNLKVGLEENSKLLEVTIINIDSKEKKVINISGLIPTGATPDCVLLNTEIERDLINELLNCNILDYCNGLFAKFNLSNMYKYDKEGVKAFLDYNTTKIEYEDKGRTVDEVKSEIKHYTEKLLQSKEVAEYFGDTFYDVNINDFIFMYSLVDKNNPKNSIIAYCNDNADTMYLISPYVKGIKNKFEIVPDWQFNFYGGMMNLLTENFEIIDIGKYSHYSIWEEISDGYEDERLKKYEKGVQKYLEFCHKNKITKEFIKEMYNLEYLQDVMKYYEKKIRDRGR